jgi:phage tail-like protein
MALALTASGINLQITPMQITESAAPLPNGLGESEDRSVQCPEILVYPGERCRVVIGIKNWESVAQSLTVVLDGTFPLQWCDDLVLDSEPEPGSGMTLATIEVPAKSSWNMDLWFAVPADFFEAHNALANQPRNRLNLDFQGHFSVYAGSRGLESPPIQQSVFELKIRPHSIYTTFLPTVYQEIDIIHRLIKIFEQAFDPVVNSFAAMWATLDPLTAPQTLLPFLAHWVDWPIDSRFDLIQQRQLIRRAVEIYRWRGTRRGLRFYLHLYTGLPLDEEIPQEEHKSIAITEPFGQGCVLGIAHLGQDAVLGGGRPFHFQVCLRAQPNHVLDEHLIRRIIDQEKPAFCTYDLMILRAKE